MANDSNEGKTDGTEGSPAGTVVPHNQNALVLIPVFARSPSS